MNTGYNEDEDLLLQDNKILIIENKNSNHSSRILSSDNENLERIKTIYRDNLVECFIYKRIMIVLTLFSVFVTYVCMPIILTKLDYDLYNFYTTFKPKNLHFQISFEVFMILWILMLIIIGLKIITCLFYMSDETYNREEYRYIIANKLGHKFYIANLLMIAYLFTCDRIFYIKNGINFSLIFFSSIFYFLSYLKIKGMLIVNRYNSLTFNFTISSFLAWSNILFFSALFILIDFYKEYFDNEVINTISLLMHLFIFGINVLLIVFCNDLYYTIIMLIYQIGIVLQNKELYTNEEKFTLVITILTAIILCWSIYGAYKKKELTNHSTEMKMAYMEEKDNNNIIS